MRRRTSTVGRAPTNCREQQCDEKRSRQSAARKSAARARRRRRSRARPDARSHSNAASMSSSSSPNTASCTPESRANWTIERAVFRNACSGLRADGRGARFGERLPERQALPLQQLLALVGALHSRAR